MEKDINVLGMRLEIVEKIMNKIGPNMKEASVKIMEKI